MERREFDRLVASIEKTPGYRQPIGFGIARMQFGQVTTDKVLTCQFAAASYEESPNASAILQWTAGLVDPDAGKASGDQNEIVIPLTRAQIEQAYDALSVFLDEAKGEAHRNTQAIKWLYENTGADLQEGLYRLVFLYADEKCASLEAAYLKLTLLSLGKVAIRQMNLDGVFGLLENVAWSGMTAYELDYLRQNEIAMKLGGTYPAIDYVDKFPRYLMQIIPAQNTRILANHNVRFGAQLAPGTTIMPGASYVNFNAGTLGPCMVEGRISSSAIVGAHSDVGGGASIMGVLSGTDGKPITIGEKCLLGANSVTGIPLGDGCIIDAGMSVLPGMKFSIAPQEWEKIASVNPNLEPPKDQEDGFYVVKGNLFQNCSGLHFRRCSQSGRALVLRSTREVKLNKDLHDASAA